jgi:hypothetical protein
MRSSFRWGWHKAGEYLNQYVVGAVVLGALAVFVSNKFVAPVNASPDARLAFSVAAFVGVAVLLGIGVLVFAVVRAPYQQRNSLGTIVAELRQQILDQSPDLEGRILQVITPPDVPGGTLAFVNMTIRNRGFQSVVDHDWEASITIGGTKQPAELPALLQATTLEMADGGAPIVITPADVIYEKGTKLIVRGDQISGWLPLWVSGVRAEEFLRLGNIVEVTFKDFLGKPNIASKPFDGKISGRAHYFPGSQNPAAPNLRHPRLPRKAKSDPTTRRSSRP